MKFSIFYSVVTYIADSKNIGPLNSWLCYSILRYISLYIQA